MENPWKDLPACAPYLLSSDEKRVMAFNSEADDVHKIRYELFPEPYLGNKEAEIVLLNLNPGFSEDDDLLYDQAFAREIWRKNIYHTHLSIPSSFSILNFASSQVRNGGRDI